jgi:hypothetical protein
VSATSRAPPRIGSARQTIRKLLEDRSRSQMVEDLVLGPYRTCLSAIAITDLKAANGFGAPTAADPLKKTEAEPVIVPIATPGPDAISRQGSKRTVTARLRHRCSVPNFLGNSIGANNRELKLFSMFFRDSKPVNNVHNKSVTVRNVRFFACRSR